MFYDLFYYVVKNQWSLMSDLIYRHSSWPWQVIVQGPEIFVEFDLITLAPVLKMAIEILFCGSLKSKKSSLGFKMW